MSLPQIAISYSKSIPAEVFDDFVQIVSVDNLDLHVESREEEGPYAGLEWLIPTAVIVFLGKSYFDGFLKEMGKDHYNLLKAGLKTLREKLLGTAAPEVTVISTAGKTRKDQPYSLVYSILAETDAGFRFKLLLQRRVSEREYDEILDAFLTFLAAYHAYSLDREITEKLKTSRVVGGTLLLAFNQKTKAIEPLDPMPKRPINEA